MPSTPSSARLKEACFILVCQESARAGVLRRKLRQSGVGLWMPQGTVFAFTEQLAVSAHHNLYFSANDDRLFDEFGATTFIRKNAGDPVAGLANILPLEIVDFNKDDDWVVFRRKDGEKFKQFIPIAKATELPMPNAGYVKTYYARIDSYKIQASYDLEITGTDATRINSYQIPFHEDDKKTVVPVEYTRLIPALSTTTNDSKRSMICIHGDLEGGACGAPHVDHQSQKAISYHLYSGSHSMTVQEFIDELKKKEIQQKQESEMEENCSKKARSDFDESSISGYHSDKFGLVFSRVPSFVNFARRQGIELNPSIN